MIDSIIEILFEEDYTKTVAIYGGGFKPPTKGHFTVAQEALKELPDIDELKIFVGGGVRDGITQNESIQIWDIYKNYLSPKVDVEASVAPVKSVLGYAKENPETKVYWILGAREGDGDDLKDIENRTKSLDKYPNIEVKVITTAGGISGTKTRQAIRDNNKELFFNLIPDVSEEEKQQMWDLVSPLVTEDISTTMKSKLTAFINAVKQEGKETREALKLILQAAKGDIELSEAQKEQIGDQLKDILKTIGLAAIAVLPGGVIVAALIKLFKADHLITPSSFVNEIGDASAKVYPFSSNKSLKQIMDSAIDLKNQDQGYPYYSDNILYTFDTEKAKYLVEILIDMEIISNTNSANNPNEKSNPPFNTTVQVIFTTEGNPGDETTNLNEQYSVLSTITEIILEFVEEFNKEGGNITAVQIAPKSDNDNLSKIDSKRGKFYTAYIKKNLAKIPGYSVREKSNYQGYEYIEIYKTNNINEVGEGNLSPYKWEETDKKSYWYQVKFITDSGIQYEVDLENTIYIDKDVNELEAFNIEFGAKLKDSLGYSSDITVNKGELYRVMATIADIIRYYIEKYNIKVITYSPAKKGNEVFGTQRDKLYKAFIRKAMPGTHFEQQGEYIAAMLPDKVSFNETVTNTEVICDNKCGHDNNPNLQETTNINEVGEANLKPYKWEETDREKYSIYTEFTTNSDTIYNVDLEVDKYKGIPIFNIEFSAKPKGAEGSSSKIVVNKGEMYKVMSTIVNIIKTYLKKFKQIEGITYYPSKKGNEEFGFQRDNLYKAFISKTFPGVKFEPIDNTLYGSGTVALISKSPNLQEINTLPSAEQKIDILPQGKLFDDAKNIESIFNKSYHSWSETIESFEKNKDKGKEQNVDIKDIYITQPNIQSNKVKNMIANIDKLPVINVVEFPDGEKVIYDGHHRLIANWALGNTKIKVNLIKVDELKENDPFGIKAYARELVKEVFEVTWKPEESFVSLSKYMIDNGMNIKPLPKIKVIKDDEQNASNLLGKTAYYNPAEKSITLYTMNRHPKDILRSFAHEMVHHEQNLEGRLNNITTTNTNEDGDLVELEKEAYLKGNIMLRNWEDKIKNV